MACYIDMGNGEEDRTITFITCTQKKQKLQKSKHRGGHVFRTNDEDQQESVLFYPWVYKREVSRGRSEDDLTNLLVKSTWRK